MQAHKTKTAVVSGVLNSIDGKPRVEKADDPLMQLADAVAVSLHQSQSLASSGTVVEGIILTCPCRRMPILLCTRP